MVSFNLGTQNWVSLNLVRSNRFHSIKYRAHLVTVPEHVGGLDIIISRAVGLDKPDLNNSKSKMCANRNTYPWWGCFLR